MHRDTNTEFTGRNWRQPHGRSKEGWGVDFYSDFAAVRPGFNTLDCDGSHGCIRWKLSGTHALAGRDIDVVSWFCASRDLRRHQDIP